MIVGKLVDDLTADLSGGTGNHHAHKKLFVWLQLGIFKLARGNEARFRLIPNMRIGIGKYNRFGGYGTFTPGVVARILYTDVRAVM